MITTHVLDTARGCPAEGVPVVLERIDDERWQVVGQGATDANGRLKDLVPPSSRSALAPTASCSTRGAYFARQTFAASFPTSSSRSRSATPTATTTSRCFSARSVTARTGARRINRMFRRRPSAGSLTARDLHPVLLRSQEGERRPWHAPIRASLAIGSRSTPCTAARISSARTQREKLGALALAALDEYAPDARCARGGAPADLQTRTPWLLPFARASSTSFAASRSRTSGSISRTATATGRMTKRTVTRSRQRQRSPPVPEAGRCRRSSASASSRCRASCTGAACARSISS